MPRGTRSILCLALAGIAIVSGALSAHGDPAAVCSTPPRAASLELVYRLQAGEEGVTLAARDRTVAIVCERLQALAGSGGMVHALGSNRIRVVLPQMGAGKVRRVTGQLGVTGQIEIYDWEPNLIGRERRIGGHPGQVPPAGALERAKREWRAAGREVESPSSLQLIFSGALPTARDAVRLAAGTGSSAGTTILSEQPIDRLGRPERAARPGWYALKDRPVLTGSDIVEVRQESGALGEPTVRLGFSAEGREAFQELTRRIARRGQAQAIGPVTGEQAMALSGHFAIVLDHEVKVRPVIDFVEYPDGIDGGTGVQISGGFTSAREARDLVRILEIGALPVEMALLRQRTPHADR